MLKRFLPKKDVSLWKKIGFWLVTVSVGFVALGLIVTAATIVILSIGLPDVTKLENLNPPESTQIFDKDGKLIYTIHGEENRDQVDIKEISPFVVEATVSIEDSGFWEHGGFDMSAIAKAVLYEVFGIGNPRGGSTITQQYIKNSFLSSERTYTRKAKELILALRLERAFTKEEIIELYLNRIPYGNNAYGIEKAAEVYFAKHAKDLTLGESAILASLPQAPSRYNPYGDNRYSHLLKEFTAEELEDRDIESETDLEIEEYARGVIGKHVDIGGSKVYIPGRSDLVLKSMNRLGYITKEQWQEALNEIQSIEFNTAHADFNHPHFVLYIKQVLEDKYGKDVVEQGGLKVYTTLDSELQEYAEKVALERGESNEASYGVNNNAILTMDVKTGHILAMVGSRQYDMEGIDGNVNVVFRPRQPGSSFKPIVYAQAFYNGYGPGSVVYDVPTKIGPDRPSNYDGKWQGQITIRRALAQSRNIPAIKAYYLAGQQDPIINLAEKMGITTLNKSHSYGYPLALGAGEIPLSEMVTAYSVFANNGKKAELNGILKVENANGDVLEEWQPTELPEVLDPQIAYMINSILSDQKNSVGPRIFVKGHHNAAKTGTSTKQNKKEAGGAAVRPSDGWTIGYTPSVVTGVWIGNTDGTGLGYNADGYNAAALIFNDVMTKALEDYPDEPFPKPEGIKEIKISTASGKLPGSNTPAEFIMSEIFASFAVPTETENLFFEVEIDKISGLLATEFTPESAIEKVTYQNYEDVADMLNWKQEVIAYYSGKEDAEGETKGVKIGLPPKEYDNVHTAETAAKAPTVIILDPVTQGELPIGNNEIQVEVSAPNGAQMVEFYLDDERKFFSTTAPYTGFINISRFLDPGSRHLIVAKVVDALGYSSQSAIEVKISRDSDTSDAPEDAPKKDQKGE